MQARARTHIFITQPHSGRAEPRSRSSLSRFGIVTIVFRRRRGSKWRIGRRRHRGGEDISSLQRASITSRAFLNGLQPTPRFAIGARYKSPDSPPPRRLHLALVQVRNIHDAATFLVLKSQEKEDYSAVAEISSIFRWLWFAHRNEMKK